MKKVKDLWVDVFRNVYQVTLGVKAGGKLATTKFAVLIDKCSEECQ